MGRKKIFGMDAALFVFFVFISVYGIANGLADGVLSNYFKEVYSVDALQRGIIEFPRELPGVLCVFVLSALSFLGDVRTAIAAMFFFLVGTICLGLFTPAFGIMLVFVFLNSLGTHMLMPLNDGIGISLITDEKSAGKRIGQYTGTKTAFQMLAAILVFLGFGFGVFSFQTEIKWIFVAGFTVGLAALGLIIYLSRLLKEHTSNQKPFKLILKKEYRFYYALCILAGAQKQIMIVYGPWVIIEILGKKTDTMALLTILGSFIGIFFIQSIGRWIDRFGLRKMLYADAFSFILVYLLYGLITQGFNSGAISTTGVFAVLTMGLFILDRMSMQFSIVRTAYLRNIALEPSHITATISAGISMDHIVSIIFAYICGIVWTTFGAQYVFFFLAALSVCNVLIAGKVKLVNRSEETLEVAAK